MKRAIILALALATNGHALPDMVSRAALIRRYHAAAWCNFVLAYTVAPGSFDYFITRGFAYLDVVEDLENNDI